MCSSTSDAIVSVNNVSVEYRGHARGPVRALDGVSLDIASGKFVCLVGASGCGKTTLLKCVGGFVRPTSGEITVAGAPVTGPGLDRAMVFQEYALFPWRTALRNVTYGLERKGMAKREARDKAREHLQLVGLQDFVDAYPFELSGGMKQRVAIARALVYEPKILLMDEPFAAVDAMTRRKLQAQMVEIWQTTGGTVIYVTHDLTEAVFLADRIIAMTPRPGRIRQVYDVDLERPRNRLSTEFNQLEGEVDAAVGEIEDTGERPTVTTLETSDKKGS